MSNARNLSKVVTQLYALAPNTTKLNSIATRGADEPGFIKDWAFNWLPAGYLWCDGSFLGPATPYQDLRNYLIADGFPYGSDGAGNPRLPDSRGRTTAGKDNMGGTAAGRLTTAGSGIDGTTLGAGGGAETHSLDVNQMPTHGHGVNDPGHAHSYLYTPNVGGQTGGGAFQSAVNPQGATTGASGTGISIQVNGGGAAHNNTQPTLVVNKIIKT
jgi:microcystin-dependent protein